jgi:hypothetical protein
MEKSRKPFTVRLFIALLAFQAFCALWGGLVLMINPSGSIMQFPPSFADKIPFANFFIPGLTLFSLLGVLPALALYGLLKKPQWQWVHRFNVYKDQLWAWTFSLYTAIILILWIDFQIMILGYQHFIQAFFALVGTLLLIVTLLPRVKAYYKI